VVRIGSSLGVAISHGEMICFPVDERLAILDALLGVLCVESDCHNGNIGL